MEFVELVRGKSGLTGLLFFERSRHPLVVKTGAKQIPADGKIMATAATAIWAEVNQADTEAEQDSVEPKCAPSEVMVLVAVTVTTILDAVFLEIASKLLFFVDRRWSKVGQRFLLGKKRRWEVNSRRPSLLIDGAEGETSSFTLALE